MSVHSLNNYRKLPKSGTPGDIYLSRTDDGKEAVHLVTVDGELVEHTKLLVVKQGPTGDTGARGVKGHDGQNSTVAGPKGDKGDSIRGPAGLAGVDGRPGKDGRTPTREQVKAICETIIRENAELLRGAAGRDGRDGATGVQGPAGDVLYIGPAQVAAAVEEVRAELKRHKAEWLARILDHLEQTQGGTGANHLAHKHLTQLLAEVSR